MREFYFKNTNLYFEQDYLLNKILNNPKNKIRCKFYSIDIGSFATWKHKYAGELYIDHTHWTKEEQIYK